MNKLFRKNCELHGTAPTLLANYQAHAIASAVPHLTQQTLSLLDFGCSDGLLTSFLQQQLPNAQITGIDTNLDKIAFAQEAYPGINFSCTQAVTEKQYDLIIVSNTLHHIPHAQHSHTIKMLHHNLKPNGTIIVLELNPLNPVTALRFAYNPHEKNAQMLSHWHTQKLLRKIGPISTQFLYPKYESSPFFFTGFSKVPFGSLYLCKTLYN